MATVLQLAIGLVFVFLLFSLVVTAANEFVLSLMNKRAAFLELGIREFLQDRDGKSGEAADFFAHPLIQALSRGPDGRPSYVDAKTFARVVIDLIEQPEWSSVVKTVAKTDVLKSLQTLKNPLLSRALTTIMKGVPASDPLAGGTSRDVLQGRLEEAYNATMERVSGWYKKHTQTWLLIIGFLLAVGGNVDTVHIVEDLAVDQSSRERLMSEAIGYTQNHAPAATPAPRTAPTAPTGAPGATPARVAAATPTAGATPAPGAASSTTDTVPVADNAEQQKATQAKQQQEVENKFKTLKSAARDIGAIAVPMGWEKRQKEYFKTHWITSIVGWLIMAFAGSLGAPFWFDTLNRVVNIRAAGVAPAERKVPEREKGTPDVPEP
jgi:hypothetical protein